MRFTLAFHDSEVRGVAAHDGVVTLRFSAASVRAADGSRGWLSGVTLALPHATLAGDALQAFGKVAEGWLRQDGRAVDRPALPGTLAGDLELTLRLANGASLALRGRTLALGVDEGARFTDDFSC